MAAETSTSPIFKYSDLVYNLVMKEMHVRYMGAFIGFAWSLASPILTTATYIFVFTYLFPSGQIHFPLFLIVGVLHWNLFAQVAGNGSEVLVSNASLLQKVFFPRHLLPLASVFIKLVLWLSGFLVFLVVYPFIGGKFSTTLFMVPIFLSVVGAFMYGVALILSTLYVEYRDLKHLVEVALPVLFWVTPIVYPLTKVPPILRTVMEASPIAELVVIAQDLFYYNTFPSAYITLAFVSWTALVIAFGTWLFNKRVPLLIERL